MPRRRRGRPGVVGTMARTAVVAGTATAVHSTMTKGKQQDAAAAQQAAAESQVQIAEMQGQINALNAQQAAEVAPAPAAAPAGGGGDVMSQLQKLADMKAAGLLSDEEFASAKAKLLA